jgi:hypothetical protein
MENENDYEREYEVLSIVCDVINKYESSDISDEHRDGFVCLLADDKNLTDTLRKLFVMFQERTMQYFQVLDMDTDMDTDTPAKVYSAYEEQQVSLFLKYIIENYKIPVSKSLISACVGVFGLLFKWPTESLSLEYFESMTAEQVIPAQITTPLSLCPHRIRARGGKRL